MSWWDQNIDRLVRIEAGDYGLKVPFAKGSIGVDKSKVDWYTDFSISLTRADDDGCCDDSCSCCSDICCNCCEDKPAKENGFKAIYRAMSYMADGCLYFRLDDALFDRGSGRYEGMLQSGDGKGCDGYKELCPFVLIIDEGICLDWNKAKGVKLDPSKLGGCE